MQVYPGALIFRVKVYSLTKTDSYIAKNYGLTYQSQKASLSIANNSAEGFERETKKELIRFLYFSKSSAGECRNVLHFLQLLEYSNEENFYEH